MLTLVPCGTQRSITLRQKQYPNCKTYYDLTTYSMPYVSGPAPVTVLRIAGSLGLPLLQWYSC